MTRRLGDAPSAPSGADDGPPVIAALTGIRAVAALAVVLLHVRAPLYALLPSTYAADRWLAFGSLGVDVFFVLSGFIISHNYAAWLAVPDRRRYRAYALARFARLYPVHLVTFLLAAVMVWYFAGRGAGLLSMQEHTALGFVGNLLMLQAFPSVEAWNGPAWTISCEAAAYVVFPLVAGFLLRLRRRTALVLAAVVALGQPWIIQTLGLVPGGLALNWVRLVGEFTLGCLLWAAWRHGVRRHRRWDVAALAAIGMALALLALGRGWLAVPFLALFVVATASATGIVRAVLASRPLEWGGRISYSVYMAHLPVIAVMFGLLPPATFAAGSLPVRLAVVSAYFLAVLVAAAVLYYAVEEPARTWIRRRAAARSSARSPGGPAGPTRSLARPRA